MNYLAHLYFAQHNAESCLGNLLGDFQKGVQLATYSKPIQLGVQNHVWVDRFTDSHHAVKAAKSCFSAPRRRFAGIALDVLFDHFLLRHWSHYSEQPPEHLFSARTELLLQLEPQMPQRLRRTVGWLLEEQGYLAYEQLAGLGHALDNIARRIRFPNQFAGAVKDIERHYDVLETTFFELFDDLSQAVAQLGPEAQAIKRQG